MIEEAVADAPVEAGQADVTESPVTDAPVEAAPSNWYDGHEMADEDIGYIQNKQWDTPNKMLDGYKNLEKFHGVPADQLIKLPSDMEAEGAMDAVYNQLGRPEDVSGYGDVELPEGVEVDTARVEWADSLFHSLGLNTAQRNALIAANAQFESQAMNGMTEAGNEQRAADLAKLKSEWGGQFDERRALANNALRAFLPGDVESSDPIIDKIQEAVGTDVVLKLFANIGDKIGEDKIPTGENKPFGYSPEQAKADIKQLMTELQGDGARLKTYNEAKGVDYDKMKRLQAVAYG